MKNLVLQNYQVLNMNLASIPKKQYHNAHFNKIKDENIDGYTKL